MKRVEFPFKIILRSTQPQLFEITRQTYKVIKVVSKALVDMSEVLNKHRKASSNTKRDST